MKYKSKYLLIAPAVIAVIAMAIVLLHVLWPDWMYLNYSYADHIDVKTYLVDKEQLNKLFKESNITQKNFSAINRDEAYIVVRIKNTGDVAFWGTLICLTNDSMLAEIDVPLIMYGDDKYKEFIFPATNKNISVENDMPAITTGWKWLYTK